ncbi:MAG: hypothetical protein HN531_14690 [Opitutae bacterium]|nr:hypothetical protein [Opitutae bacterium]
MNTRKETFRRMTVPYRGIRPGLESPVANGPPGDRTENVPRRSLVRPGRSGAAPNPCDFIH